MTLEAALVVPMALCAIVLIIYFSFYLYGRCQLTQDAYIMAFRATVRDNAEGPVEYVAQRAPDILGKKYFGNNRPHISAAQRGKTVIVTGKSQAHHSAMGRYFLKPEAGWDYSVSMEATKRELPKHIRTMKRLRDLGKEISDGL